MPASLTKTALALRPIAAICLAGTPFGQTETSQAPGGEEPVQDEVVEGLLPVPQYAGKWTQRPFLSGSWGGTRQRLADDGITFGLDLVQVGQGIVTGGRDQRWAFASNIDYRVNLDLMRMGAVPGALVTFRAQSRFGDTVNADTGLLLPVNTYSYFPLTSPPTEDVPFAITELNWTQFFGEHWGLLVGKITTMESTNEFAGGEGRSQFMNFQFSFSAVVAQVAPYSTLALGGVWVPSPKVTVTSIVMNTADASTTTGLDDIGDATSWATMVDTQHRLGRLPGGFDITGIYAFNGDFGRVGGLNGAPGEDVSLETAPNAWAFFVSGWQYVHTEQAEPGAVDPSNGRQDYEGLGLFAQLGLADRDTNPVSWSGTVGLGGRGSIRGRDDDTWGVGYFYNRLQSLNSVIGSQIEGSAQGMEGYYNIAFTPSVAFTLDLQLAGSGAPGIDNSVIAGVRLDVSF